MIFKLEKYNGTHRIVSLALDQDTFDNLLKEDLDFIYVDDNSLKLYPEDVIISTDEKIIDKIKSAHNYDVFELWENGKLITCYDDESLDNAFFVTGKCNSNCIMCPSPNVSRQKGKNSDVDKLIEIAKHIPSDAPHLTITGGEPFMIGRDIFRFIQYLHDKFTCTEFLFLTNGRIFAVDSFMKKFIETVPDNSIVAIPIHGSNAQINDMITQSKGSFAQTVKGIKQLLKANIRVELRIVVSKLNASNLHDLALFISQEFSEVEYVSIMAMEMTGSARVNQDKVWISYKEAGRLAQDAALVLIENGIDVRVVDIHTIKPIDRDIIIKCAKETKKLISIEDHNVVGGLGSAISEVLTDECPTKLIRLGINDTFGKSGNAVELMEYFGITAEKIIEIVKK